MAGLNIGDEVKKLVEVQVKSLIVSKGDEAIHEGLDLIKKAIKGDVDDTIINLLEPKLAEALKAYALLLADKISPLV